MASIKKAILVAEDDPLNMRLFRDVLEQMGFTVFEAGNGQQAIDMAVAHTPDLILMDLQMPVMDGYQALQHLKTDPRFKSIPITIVTANVMDNEEARVKELGADAFMRKPIKLRDFERMVRELVSSTDEPDV